MKTTTRTTKKTDAKVATLTESEWEWARALRDNKGVPWADAVNYVLSWR